MAFRWTYAPTLCPDSVWAWNFTEALFISLISGAWVKPKNWRSFSRTTSIYYSFWMSFLDINEHVTLRMASHFRAQLRLAIKCPSTETRPLKRHFGSVKTSDRVFDCLNRQILDFDCIVTILIRYPRESRSTKVHSHPTTTIAILLVSRTAI